MSKLKQAEKYLSVLLAGAVALALASLFVLLGAPSEDTSPWTSLSVQVIPSLIAALVAYIAVYLALELQGIALSESNADRAAAVARKLLEYQYGDPSRGPGTERNLAGQWRMQDWRHDHPGDTKDAKSEDAMIYQDGRVVWGTFSTNQGPKKDGESSGAYYAFLADLEGDILTGRWWQVEEQNPWKGAFQFKYRPGNQERETMEGCWVGFNYDRSKINSGGWEWARPNQPFPSERRAESIPTAKPHPPAKTGRNRGD